jgi:hypothetical protein
MVENRSVFARIPFAGVMHFPKINAVLQKMGEGSIGEGNAALILRDFGITCLGNNASAVEILN